MKVFKVCYFQQFGYGAYDDGDGFVIANTESEALGLCLESNPDTSSEFWSLEEVELSESNVFVTINKVGQL